MKYAVRAMLIICMVGSTAIKQAAAQDVTLDEIRARLDAWEESIAQFRVVWETTYDPEAKLAHESGVGGVQIIARNDWARSARGEEHWHDVGRYDGEVHLRSLHVRTAEAIAYSALYDPGVSVVERPSQLRIGPGGEGWTSMNRRPFIGLWMTRQDAWLPSALQELPARLEGTVEWEGRELPFLIVETDPTGEMELALDPEAGYLPRTARAVALTEEGRRLGATFETTEFREVKPGFFFPWRGREINDYHPCTWEIIELQLNEPLDPDLFKKIEPVEGTFVENMLTGEFGHHGKKPERAAAAQIDAPQVAPEGPPAAAIASRTPLGVILAGIGVLLLAAAWWMQKSRSGAKAS
ncbi:MAG: hypothetical protein DWQ34_14280 [Planctomycetota bacterium]|nr:MAG: hypothetical protein DWQ34_14280 [Planctomycetota bacterium]REK20022.1 MAG: hypothetical protein DWQ41_27275 [Planctomycetota bacterium]REK27589.1 MAG: hypothetical protein DWQ45_26295 [Planctomycetota bacterium]